VGSTFENLCVRVVSRSQKALVKFRVFEILFFFETDVLKVRHEVTYLS
jgi:hypothetical protein